MYRSILLTVITALLSACGLGGGPVPADHFYRLPEVVLERQSKPAFDTLVIKPVKASGLYHERAMLYINESRPLEIQRYHYNFWIKKPAELIHEGLYQGFKSRGVAVNISRKLNNNSNDYILDSRITHFERILDGQNVTVRLGLDITLSGPDLSGGQWSKHYLSSQKLNTNDSHASAKAYGAALQDIVLQLAGDLLVK